MGKGGGDRTYYYYHLGMHMVLCHGPIDAVTQLLADDKVMWSGTNPGTHVVVDNPTLFGGRDREGGIEGRVDFDFGGSTQAQNSYLLGVLGSDVPAYRGVVSVILNQIYLSTTPYIKSWKFRVRRTTVLTDGTAQWQPGYATINTHDANPAHIIRECLTDQSWGMGYNDSDIDEVSFSAAAQTLYTEGMGMSLLWDKQTPLEDFISQVMKHISGSLFVDKSTGQFSISLVRDDYVLGSLPVLDETTISRVTEFARPVVGELTNSVTVVYWDRDTGETGSVTVQDIALAHIQQCNIGVTVQYPGFTNGLLATTAASRDLRVLATPLIACTIYVNRAAAELTIGSPFVFSWEDFGIESVVMRVVEMAYGGVNNSEICIKATQDVFAVGDALVAAPPVTEWTNPVSDPIACSIRKGYSATYWDTVMKHGKAVADGFGSTSGALLICAESPTPDSVFANLRTVDSSGDYVVRDTLNFCPVAQVASAVTITDTIISIENTVDTSSAKIGAYVQVDDELMRLDAVSEVSVTVGRGILDTVPVAHSLGSRVYFNGFFSEGDGVEYGIGESPGVKLTPITGNGELEVAAAPTDYIGIVDRVWLPYAPGNVKVNGVAYPTSVDETLDITFLWSHRDRTQQLSESLYDTTTGNIGPETDVTYTLQVLTPGLTVIQQWTGLTSTSQLIDVATLGANADIRVRLWSVRDGVASYQIHDFQFARVP